MTPEHNYNPKDEFLISPPGDTIEETMRELGMTDEQFIEKMNLPGFNKIAASLLCLGVLELSPEIAERLEVVFGISKDFWIAREELYRKKVAKLKSLKGDGC